MRNTGPFLGILCFFVAVRIIAENPPLLSLVIWPIIINFLIGAVAYIFLLFPSLQWYDSFTAALLMRLELFLAKLPSWLYFSETIIQLLFLLFRGLILGAIFVIIGYVILQFGTIIGSPWYGKLSERVELLKKGKIEAVEVGPFGEIVRALGFEVKKIILSVMALGFLLGVNWLPVVGQISSVLGGWLLGVTLVCLDFFDATLERRRWKFRRKLGFIWGNFLTTFPFGFICLVLISVPLLNLIVIPLCITAGTLLVCEYL